VPLVPQAKEANQEKTVPLVLLVLLAMLEPLAALAKLVPLAPLEMLARLVPLAAAITAHQLVWPQVIKRLRFPSRAMRPNRRPLGRPVDNHSHTIPSLYSPAAFLFDSLVL
jgi:hypothetical protein